MFGILESAIKLYTVQCTQAYTAIFRLYTILEINSQISLHPCCPFIQMGSLKLRLYSLYLKRHALYRFYRVSQKKWELRDDLKVVFDFCFLLHGKESKKLIGCTPDELFIKWSTFLAYVKN